MWHMKAYSRSNWAILSGFSACPKTSTLSIKSATNDWNSINLNKQNPIPRFPNYMIICRSHNCSLYLNCNFILAWPSKNYILYQVSPCWHINCWCFHWATRRGPCLEKSLSWICFPIWFCTQIYHIVCCVWWFEKECEEERKNTRNDKLGRHFCFQFVGWNKEESWGLFMLNKIWLVQMFIFCSNCCCDNMD